MDDPEREGHPDREFRGVAPEDLLERDRERRALDSALASARRGVGVTAAIEGEAGIGKSVLLSLACDLAEAGSMTLCRARAGEAERDFSYGVLSELVESLARGLPDSGGSISALEAGELSALLEPAREPAPGEMVVARRFCRLVERTVAKRPLLIAVDDAHWADLPSLRMLLYLARRVEAIPAAICVATRPVSEAGAGAPALDALLVEAADRILMPAPLGLGASAELISGSLGKRADPAFGEACHRASGGNPLLLRELARGFATEEIEPSASRIGLIPEIGGRAVSRTVRLRMSHLGPEAQRLAAAAAVLGERTPLTEAARIAGLDQESAFAGAARLATLEIWVDGGLAEFVHPLVREAVLADLPPAEASRLHAAAAEMLIGLGAAPERVATHLLESPPMESAEAVRILRDAAAAAASAGDSRTAAAFLNRALEEPPPDGERAEILLELAASERHHDAERATARIDAALRLIEDPRRKAIAGLRLAELLPAIDPERAIEVIEPHLAGLGEADLEAQARVVMLTGALLSPGLIDRARVIAEQLRPGAEGSGTEARAATALIGYLDSFGGRSASDLVPGLEAAVAAPLEPRTLAGQLIFGMIVLVAADSPVALSVSERWCGLAEETEWIGTMTAALMCRAHAMLARGRLEQATADGRAGLEVSELYVGGAGVSWAGAALVQSLIESGELDQAQRSLNRIGGSGGAGAPDWTLDLHGLLGCRAELAAASGDRLEALELSLEQGRRCDRVGLTNPALAPWRSRAALCLAASNAPEDAARARRLAAGEVELATAWGAPRALGRAISVLAAVDSDREDAEELHRRAVEVLEPSPARLELARALLRQGSAMRRRGARAGAREPLRRAAGLAERCGAAPLAERAREELVAAGARPRRAEVTGPGSLTPRERRVASIAAEGCSNQEIAERLYVSVRTVESHLSSVYVKLGINSRSQLAGLGLEPEPEAASG